MEIMKKTIIIYLFLSVVLIFTGCKQNDYDSGKYEVIESIKSGENTLTLDYSEEENKITYRSSSTPDTKFIVYLNDDGVITSIYIIEADYGQYPYFESESIKTVMTPSGYIESIEYFYFDANPYDNSLKVDIEYDNYDDNTIKSIVYRDWEYNRIEEDDWEEEGTVWSNENLLEEATSEDFFEEDLDITYKKTDNPCYKMFKNEIWFISMIEQLKGRMNYFNN